MSPSAFLALVGEEWLYLSEVSYDLSCTARGIFLKMCMSWTLECLNRVKGSNVSRGSVSV